MGVTNSSHQQFVEMVSKGYKKVDEAAAKLAETLADYGFKGNVTLALDVRLEGDNRGEIQQRSSTFAFKR